MLLPNASSIPVVGSASSRVEPTEVNPPVEEVVAHVQEGEKTL